MIKISFPKYQDTMRSWGAMRQEIGCRPVADVSIRAPAWGAIVVVSMQGFIRLASGISANLLFEAIKELVLGRKSPRPLWVRGGLEDERAFDVVVIVFAVVLNLLLPVFSKMINPNTVGFCVDNRE